MAGLIGSSNSPISGVGILVAVTAAALVRTIATTSSPDDVRTLVAYTLFVTAVVFGVATISNDNLQDLKTGQLVDSTPWKQQVALVIGVVFGAIVIPPVLSLMQGAFGFAGAPDAGDDALAAPQANLIKHLVQGVLGGDLNWSLLGLGALIGAVVIAIDEILRRTSKYSLPPLAVGMGMYLPTAVTVMIPIGAALGHLYDRWAERTANPERAKRMGTLMATGLSRRREPRRGGLRRNRRRLRWQGGPAGHHARGLRQHRSLGGCGAVRRHAVVPLPGRPPGELSRLSVAAAACGRRRFLRPSSRLLSLH